MVATTAIDVQNLYVVNPGTGTIGEYGSDGSIINCSLISGLDTPFGIALFGNNLLGSPPLPWPSSSLGRWRCGDDAIDISYSTNLEPRT
jgi:hypothetical protein